MASRQTPIRTLRAITTRICERRVGQVANENLGKVVSGEGSLLLAEPVRSDSAQVSTLHRQTKAQAHSTRVWARRQVVRCCHQLP
jgi:hypothetical protein